LPKQGECTAKAALSMALQNLSAKLDVTTSLKRGFIYSSLAVKKKFKVSIYNAISQA
jgi:hypothetical protein